MQFDDKGTVKDLQTHVDDDRNVAMITRTTPAPGKELSFIEQLQRFIANGFPVRLQQIQLRKAATIEDRSGRNG